MRIAIASSSQADLQGIREYITPFTLKNGDVLKLKGRYAGVDSDFHKEFGDELSDIVENTSKKEERTGKLAKFVRKVFPEFVIVDWNAVDGENNEMDYDIEECRELLSEQFHDSTITGMFLFFYEKSNFTKDKTKPKIGLVKNINT